MYIRISLYAASSYCLASTVVCNSLKLFGITMSASSLAVTAAVSALTVALGISASMYYTQALAVFVRKRALRRSVSSIGRSSSSISLLLLSLLASRLIVSKFGCLRTTSVLGSAAGVLFSSVGAMLLLLLKVLSLASLILM